MQGIEGRLHVITGGYGGIARATAENILRLGGDVALTGRDQSKGEEAAAVLSKASGRTVRFFRMDVGNSAEVDAAIGSIEAEVGAIHGAVVNAAVSHVGPTLETTDEQWRTVLGTNLDGSFFCARAFARAMGERGGSIVVISSIASRVTGPTPFTAYGASKAGVSHLAELLGVEWAPLGIRVNAVEPGYTATDAIARMEQRAPEAVKALLGNIPIQRWLRPEEIGNAITFLLSDLSSAITGSILIADGGASAR